MQIEAPYNEVIPCKFPEQIVIGIAGVPGGTCNPITLGWTMSTSHEPPMLAVSIGLPRYSRELFEQAEHFVIAMPSEQQADETMFFGTKSGRDVDKFAEAGTALSPASKIDCVLMDQAVANFECRKVGQMTTGDHVIFVGEVIASHQHPDRPCRLYTLDKDFLLGGLRRGK